MFLAQLAALHYFSVTKFATSILQAFGILWLLTQIGAFFWPRLADEARGYWWAFLVVGVGLGLIRAWPRTVTSKRISGTDVTVSVRVGDLFAQSGAFIVGSNTTFDTSMEDGTISPKSVQGQLTKKFCNSVGQLDRDLGNALCDEPFGELSSESKPYGKRRSYPIGTTARVHCNSGRNVYLVAIARLNRNRTMDASLEDVLNALPRLWEHIQQKGSVEPLVVPVLGSGFSRVQAPREQLVQEIIRSFVAANKAGKRFCDHLTIALSPKDYLMRLYDLDRLRDFLDYECRYSSGVVTPGSDAPVGTPAPPIAANGKGISS